MDDQSLAHITETPLTIDRAHVAFCGRRASPKRAAEFL